MFLPASDAIAARHPELMEAIEAIDGLIYDIGDYPIRPTVVADNLDLDVGLLTRVLRLYAKEQVVQEEDRFYCSNCDCMVSDENQSCDICETNFTLVKPENTRV